MKRQAMTQAMKQREMQDIWESWKPIFQDKVSSLDHLTWRITSEMSICGVNAEMSIHFLTEKFKECVEKAANERSEWIGKERRRTG